MKKIESKKRKNINEVIYIEDEDVIDVEKKEENVAHLIKELSRTIQQGDGEKAASFARRLAKLNAVILMKLENSNESAASSNVPVIDISSSIDDTTAPASGTSTNITKVTIRLKQSYDDDDFTQIELDFDLATSKVEDLKSTIAERLGLPVSQQYVVINGLEAVNNDRQLSEYKAFEKKDSHFMNGFASASEESSTAFEVNVFPCDEFDDQMQSNKRKVYFILFWVFFLKANN